MRLSARQAEVLLHYFDLFAGVTTSEQLLISFGVADPRVEATVRLARLELPSDSTPLHFLATLGFEGEESPCRKSFFGVFDRAGEELGELVAGALHFDRFIEELGCFHTVPLGSRNVLRSRGSKHLSSWPTTSSRRSLDGRCRKARSYVMPWSL